jgi:hypothetical protein
VVGILLRAVERLPDGLGLDGVAELAEGLDRADAHAGVRVRQVRGDLRHGVLAPELAEREQRPSTDRRARVVEDEGQLRDGDLLAGPHQAVDGRLADLGHVVPERLEQRRHHLAAADLPEPPAGPGTGDGAPALEGFERLLQIRVRGGGGGREQEERQREERSSHGTTSFDGDD